MDPSKRRASCYGGSKHYDWFGTHINQGGVRIKGKDKNIVAFALLVDVRLGDSSGFITDFFPDVIMGSKRDYALPLGAISLAA
jgi:hypothetical protein